MLALFRDAVVRAEEMARAGDAAPCLEYLRTLPIDDFCEVLLGLPNDELPYLSSVLPKMADPGVQQLWTGSEGIHLLKQTLAFTRSVAQNHRMITGKDLKGARVLDFGCGYGRILRAMYYFNDPVNLFGCDPWDESLKVCRQDRMLGNLAPSEYLPTSLPFEGHFDLIYAFSVFTHLSERAAVQSMRVLSDALAPDGVIVITIFPVEYWTIDGRFAADERDSLLQMHEKRGFAFKPHGLPAIDGDVTYGDTSMTLEFIGRTFPELKVAKVDRTLQDPYQVIVFLKVDRST